MNGRLLFLVTLGCFFVFLPFPVRGEHPAEHPKEHPTSSKKKITITDISKKLKMHIEEQAEKGGGKFQIKDGEKDLALTLVKIHDNKLTQSEDGSYFVCVDFKGEDGNTYDVDFFLSGEPDAIKVEKTTIHKINGKSRYEWKQKANGKYMEVPSPSS